MKISDLLIPGTAREETFLVEEQHTAYHIGSGDEKVLGTPWMIVSWMFGIWLLRR